MLKVFENKPKITRIANTLIVFVLAFVVFLAAVYVCYRFVDNDRVVTDYREAMEVAKTDFGCDKILWVGKATAESELLTYDENIKRYGHFGAYVLGVNNNEEMFIYIPFRTKERSARVIDWQFSYSFSEIVLQLALYGYDYTQSAEENYTKGGYLFCYDNEDEIKRNVRYFIDPIVFYDSLDVKMIFTFRYIVSPELFYDNYITQEGGKIKIYRRSNRDVDVFEQILLGD